MKIRQSRNAAKKAVSASEADIIALVEYERLSASNNWEGQLWTRDDWTKQRSQELQRFGATCSERALLRAIVT